MTSQEIAEQIAQQNQFFLMQNATASQIGMNPMAFGMGAYGAGFSAGAPVMPQLPGGMKMPGAFDYGSNPFAGYGAGNRMGAMGFGALGAAPTIGLTGMELFSLTKAGAGLQPFVNPFAAFGAARGMGFGYAGAAGMAGLSMAPAAALQWGTGQMVRGGQEQSMVNTALGQYNFLNPQSRTGFGFSRDDAAAVGQQIRQLAMVPELLTSMQELTRLLPTLKASGVMQGVRDASEFNRRFREAISTIRDISKVLGTTMEEAGQFFQHSARVGFLGRGDQLRNVLQSQVVMGATGMNQGQVMQLQQQMSNLAVATGVTRGTMVEAGNRMAATMGFAQQSGIIPKGALEDLTGKVGEEAVMDATARMSNLTMRLAGSDIGRFQMLGAMEMGPNGRPRINERLLMLPAEELRRRGQRNAQVPGMALAFEANQGRLAAEFTRGGGLQALSGLMGELTRQYGPEAGRFLMQQYGASEEEASLAQQLQQAGAGGMGQAQQVIASLRQQQSFMRERADPRAVFRRATTEIGNKLAQPFRRFGAELYTRITKGMDDAIDDLVGNYVVSASEESQQKFLRAFTSASGNEWKELLGGNRMTTKASTGGFSDTGLFAAFAGLGTGGTGRSQRNAFEYYSNLLGMQGLDVNKDADRAKLDAKLAGMANQFQGMKFDADQQAAIDLVRRTTRAMDLTGDYQRASPQERAEMVQRAVWKQLGDPTGENPAMLAQARRGFESLRKAGGVDNVMGGVMAGVVAAGGISARALGIGTTYVDVKGLANNLKEQEEKARRFFGADVLADLKKNPKLKTLLEVYLGAGDNQDAIHDAIASKDSRALSKATGGKINLSSEELDDALRLLSNVVGKEGEAKNIFQGWTNAVDDNTRGSFKTMFGRQSLEVADAIAAMQKDGADENWISKLGDVQASLDGAQAAIGQGQDKWAAAEGPLKQSLSAAVQYLAGMKDPSDLLSKAPRTVQLAYAGYQSARQTLSGFRVGSELSQDEMSQLQQQLNLSPDEMKRIFGDSTRLTAGVMQSLTESTERARAGAAFGTGAEQIRAESKEDQMVYTLKVIAEAVIAANKDKLGGDKEDSKANEMLKRLNAGNAAY